jgi:hypothetical protein
MRNFDLTEGISAFDSENGLSAGAINEECPSLLHLEVD